MYGLNAHMPCPFVCVESHPTSWHHSDPAWAPKIWMVNIGRKFMRGPFERRYYHRALTIKKPSYDPT